MSLPIVLILGNHRDASSDLLATNLLPKLATEGYNRYCLEYPSAWSDGILNKLKILIKNFPTQTNEDKEYLQPITAKVESIELANRHFYCTLCIDDEKLLLASNNDELMSKFAPFRDIIMTDHLFRLHKEGNGVVTVQGPGHYLSFVSRLKKLGLKDEDLVCIFPYSPSTDPYSFLCYEEAQNIKKIVHCVSTHTEINQLGNKILQEVKSKNRRVIELTENSHSRFLSDYFKVNFKALPRPQYYVDAVLPLNQMQDSIRKDLDDLGIQHRTDEHYFVIPNVNTKEVAESIRLLRYKA